MRITITGRRLALAAVLVLGGAAAPLAYATISAKAPTSTGATGAPVVAVTPTATQAPAAVADNPYQVASGGVLSGSLQCLGFPLPIGQDFVLESISVASRGALSSVTVGPAIKRGTGTFDTFGQEWTIPLSGERAGTRTFNVIVRPDFESTAAEGDMYVLTYCLTGAAGQPYQLWVTGQKLASPTAAALADFTARSGKAGTTLQWKTASETEILGFNVWRYRGAKGVKLNRTLVRAKRSGQPAGASYRYIDQVRGAKRGLTYRLQLVDLKGKRTWYAAFAIASK